MAQTYLYMRTRLSATGEPARFTDQFVPGQINVAHRDDLNNFGTPFHPASSSEVRADRPPLLAADAVVIQNPIEEDGVLRHFVPLWPQPGLRARDPARGERFTRLGYLGRTGSLPRWCESPAFYEKLRELGVEFVIREKEWHDCSDLDAILARREELPTMLTHKPATKLYNAWLADLPALVGPEPAFNAARKSDWISSEVQTAEDVYAAVKALKSRPGLYQAMVENGRERGREYSVQAIRERWLNLLTDRLLVDYECWRRTPALLRTLGFPFALLRQKTAAERFKNQLRHELRVRKRAAIGISV